MLHRLPANVFLPRATLNKVASCVIMFAAASDSAVYKYACAVLYAEERVNCVLDAMPLVIRLHVVKKRRATTPVKSDEVRFMRSIMFVAFSSVCPTRTVHVYTHCCYCFINFY